MESQQPADSWSTISLLFWSETDDGYSRFPEYLRISSNQERYNILYLETVPGKTLEVLRLRSKWHSIVHIIHQRSRRTQRMRELCQANESMYRADCMWQGSQYLEQPCIEYKAYEEILKSGGFYENGNIRLIACRNGREPAVTAHYLVDEHGVLVIAPTEMMLASGNFNQKGLSVY